MVVLDDQGVFISGTFDKGSVFHVRRFECLDDDGNGSKKFLVEGIAGEVLKLNIF